MQPTINDLMKQEQERLKGTCFECYQTIGSNSMLDGLLCENCGHDYWADMAHWDENSICQCSELCVFLAKLESKRASK